MKKVVIMGPAHPLRGGLATFNQRLAAEFLAEGDDCSLVSFSLQYPALFFPGKSQYAGGAAPQNLTIESLINSVDPYNWIKVGRHLRNRRPDIIVVRFWIPFLGPALGTVLRLVRRNNHTKIICIADNVIPHERRPGDAAFTRYFLKFCDAFITMSEKVQTDLRRFEANKPALLVQHPLYDTFGTAVPQTEARHFLKLPPHEKIILFFGFIRKYKGLDLLLQAMQLPQIKAANIKLLIAGEFYEDEAEYRKLISQYGLAEQVILQDRFIPDDEVRYFLCAADVVVQPYRAATQSGVTPLAYYFEKPMIVTDVGGLPDLVPHLKSGIVCQPSPASIAAAILQFYQLGEAYFIPHLRTEKQKYSWASLVKAIKQLAAEPQQ